MKKIPLMPRRSEQSQMWNVAKCRESQLDVVGVGAGKIRGRKGIQKMNRKKEQNISERKSPTS